MKPSVAELAAAAVEMWSGLERSGQGSGQRSAAARRAQSVEGAPAQRYVAGVVQVARALGDRAAWTELTELVTQMVAAQAPAAAPSQPVQAR